MGGSFRFITISHRGDGWGGWVGGGVSRQALLVSASDFLFGFVSDTYTLFDI